MLEIKRFNRINWIMEADLYMSCISKYMTVYSFKRKTL